MIGNRFSPPGPLAGFTLIEMLVVVMIIGILVAIGTPQYFKVVEKNKTSEAVNLFLAMKGSQDRYYSKYNAYCISAVSACGGFDLQMPTMSFFVGGGAGGGAGANPFTTFNPPSTLPGWKALLTRSGAPAVYGGYTLTYDVEKGASPVLSCSQAQCEIDLLPANN